MAMAQMEDHHGHHGTHQAKAQGAMPTMTATAKTAADRALLKVSHDMHAAMDVPLMGPPDADFLRTMIPHHQGAIDMAAVVIKYGKDADVIDLAGRIARTQTWEINLMKRLLGRMGQEKAVHAVPGAMEKSADTAAKKELLSVHHAMHAAMDVKLTGQADCDFVRAMIPHHQGAVDMAYWVMGHGYQEDAQKLAREIIKAQGVEIAWMRGWLKREGCK